MGVTTDQFNIETISKNENGHDGYDPSIVDVQDFFDRVLESYEDGTASSELAADLDLARSVIPAGTGAARDFSYIAPDIPEYYNENCTGCMTCVNQCPDTAILGKVRAILDRTLRPRAHRGISIDFEVVSVPAALARQLRQAGDGRLGESERTALDAALAGASARRVFGVRGNGLMGARFLVWHGRQVAVLSDFDVEVAQTASAADPVVEIAQAGGYLSARAQATKDGKVISLVLGLRTQELVGLRRHETRRSGNLDLPDLLTQDSQVSVKLASGVWSIVASGTPRPGEHRLFLVRASALERGGAR